MPSRIRNSRQLRQNSVWVSGIRKGDLVFRQNQALQGHRISARRFRLLSTDEQANYRLIVAGEPKKRSEGYLHEIQESAQRDFKLGRSSFLSFQFVPDEEMEPYFKGADLLVLPYKDIFQSGVLFLAYSFGLPVVATDVGSFRDDIIEGRTGFLCQPGDPAELAKAIETYFAAISSRI